MSPWQERRYSKEKHLFPVFDYQIFVTTAAKVSRFPRSQVWLSMPLSTALGGRGRWNSGISRPV